MATTTAGATGTLTRAECKRRALLAADWFVNTQVVATEPALTADHGRIIYNYHLPSGALTRGLSWSHGRAIMCLLGAWELTRRQKYLDAAVRCGEYLRFALQVMDARDKRIFGCFREEVPVSRYCYPRDAIEGAFGLLMLHLATGESDYLQRSEIFAEWYLTQVVDPAVNWPRGALYFDKPRERFSLMFFQAGGAPFFWLLYQVTGRRRYLTEGLRMLADGLLERFIDPASGAMLSQTFHRHHTIAQNGKMLAVNDDGASIALTCAHVAFARGRSRSKYLDAAAAYGDWVMNECPRPLPLFAANGMHAVTMNELTALTGARKYAKFGKRLMARQVRLQVISPSKLDRHGGFRGEDEPAKYYVKGARQQDFITTRCTAYSTLALLGLHGRVLGPAYSALGFDRFRKFAAGRKK